MKIKSITLQKIAAVCGGLGLFFGLGFAGNFETTGETSTGTFMVSLGFLLLAVLLARVSFAVQDMEKAEGRLTMFHTTVKCVDCGALMVDVPSNTKRCAVCRVGHNRESVRRANETRRAEEAARPKLRSLDDDLEALNKYNEQRRAAGREPLTYGVWRSRGAPEEYA